jgi:ubiquinone/menaquinone biosynthesis C-methylase UbiE
MSDETAQVVDQILREIRRLVSDGGAVPAVMNLEQARRYTGLPARAFQEMIRAGLILPFVPAGSRRQMFRRAQLDEAIRSLCEHTDPRRDMDFG